MEILHKNFNNFYICLIYYRLHKHNVFLFVNIGNSPFIAALVNHCVPQGSVLRPHLFTFKSSLIMDSNVTSANNTLEYQNSKGLGVFKP